VLGVYERRHTSRHQLTIERATDLRDALDAAVGLAQPACGAKRVADLET
jgi:hypothetical protein